jgi:hypothetical protein
METTERELKCLSFLRYLYDECRSNHVTLSLCEKGKEFGIGNYNVFAIKLVELGILEKRGNGLKRTYKWFNEDGPTLELTQKLFRAVSDYGKNFLDKPNLPGNQKGSRSIKVDEVLIPNKSQFIKNLADDLSIEQICELCRLKGISGTLEIKTTITI